MRIAILSTRFQCFGSFQNILDNYFHVQKKKLTIFFKSLDSKVLRATFIQEATIIRDLRSHTAIPVRNGTFTT